MLINVNRKGYIRNETKAGKVPGINGSGRINR